MTATYDDETFRDRFGPWAVIAGGSDGIGAAFAATLVRRGINLVLVARDEAKLSKTAALLREKYSCEVRCLSSDLTSPDIDEQIGSFTSDLDVGLLIYNAGSGRQMGSFLDHTSENWMRQVQLA